MSSNLNKAFEENLSIQKKNKEILKLPNEILKYLGFRNKKNRSVMNKYYNSDRN